MSTAAPLGPLSQNEIDVILELRKLCREGYGQLVVHVHEHQPRGIDNLAKHRLSPGQQKLDMRPPRV